MWPFDRLFGGPDPNTLEMSETMWGYVAKGAASFKEGYEKGKRDGNKLQYEVTIHVDNFKEFKSPSGRRAPMTGWITCKNLFGEKLPVHNGEYGLYVIDDETGQRRITYKFDFIGNDGKRYHFSGYKVISSEPWTFDILEDQTTLYATITGAGTEEHVAKGIIHYHVETFPDMVSSIRVPGADTIANRLIISRKFFSFISKELSEYIREINPFYNVEYTNLVCTGASKVNGTDIEFFFFSGVHDKGFPWGDNVSFTDIGLVFRDGDTYRRFALTEHAIENLVLRLSEGTYRYKDRLYEITDGCQVSFTEMHKSATPPHLRTVSADIELNFTAVKMETRSIPFQLDREKLDALPKEVKKGIKKSPLFKDLKGKSGEFANLGYTTEIHRLNGIGGHFTIDGTRYTIQTGVTLGEGEFGKLVGLRKPTLYYNYFCALEPRSDLFRLQVRSGVLKTLSANMLVSESEQLMGDIIGQASRLDLLVKGDGRENIEPDEAERLIKPEEDLLEINNDHFPTATFQRRIVTLPGIENNHALALEEDMNIIDLEPIRSDKAATVAAIKDPDRFNALDRVLEETNFFSLLENARSNSGKTKDEFSIVIKPNFSFMYSLSDVSTFTDPSLVEHLIDRIHEKGYTNVAVVEAQSTYTVFFTNRDVPTLARYIGLRGGRYKIIDLSENTEDHDYGRTLGRHELHPAWRDAGFRISFAKNKTHSYAYYTLTIKNIYGALPRKNKFKEYHCNRELGIYVPAIDFIEEFPIHYGLIDAYFSADGPFGIFADTEPNFTSTIIGGDDIVAVDWVGASKMGYDPMISEYLQLAVERFGKPAIRLIGDHSPYSEWRNVPEIVSKAAFGIMDRNFMFGDFLYSAAATMDPFFTFTPDEVGRKIARLFTKPLRKVLFEWVRGKKRDLTKDDLRTVLDPEQWKYVENLVKALFE
jgi:uncharacterized protein (DUF362 family)